MIGLIKSFGYALRGLGRQIACERNFRIHCVAVLTVVLFSLFYDFSAVEYGLLVLQMVLVLTAESINSAIEQTDDAVTMEQNEKIRRAKDSAAAGVLIAAIGAVVLAGLLFWDTAAFARIGACFSQWPYLLGLIAYAVLMSILILCKKTYKKEK